MTNVQLYTKRTTIHETVQLYIVYVYKAYLNTKLTIIQSIHRNKFRRHYCFFLKELKVSPVAVAGTGVGSKAEAPGFRPAFKTRTIWN